MSKNKFLSDIMFFKFNFQFQLTCNIILVLVYNVVILDIYLPYEVGPPDIVNTRSNDNMIDYISYVALYTPVNGSMYFVTGFFSFILCF